MSTARALLALLLAASAPRHGMFAQSPSERARLDSLRSSLGAIGDSTSLLTRERERIAVARQNRDDPFIHLELGLLAYRLGEVTGARKHYDDAAGEFEWAAELSPGWPYPWYWLGVAELALGEARAIPVENLRQVLGIDALSKAAAAFARALEADASFSRALIDLAATALRQRIAPRLEVAQRALRLAATSPAGREPQVLLMRGLVEREREASDSALAAFRAYVGGSGDAGVGGVEIARTLFALGRPDSAVAAYRAATRAPMTDGARQAFRRDVQWIATPAERAAFDRAPTDSAGPWLQRFWAARDVGDARRSGERLLEQFRRYAYARVNYRLVSRHRHYDITETYRDTTQAEFDDRGVIYLRHGEPDARARYVDGRVEPNESWVYRRPPPEGDLVFHFVARGDVQDFKLVESLLDAYDFSTSLALQSMADVPTGIVGGLLASRAQIVPIYERLAHGGAAGRGSLLAAERAAGRRAIQVGTTTDSYALRFARDLKPVVSSFTVADATGRAEFHVVFAIPASGLRAFAAPSGVAYPLGLRVVVFDSGMRAVAALDTVRVFRADRELSEGSYLTERLALAVPPGRYRYHFAVEEVGADAGALAGNRDVEVPRVRGGFSASDLVVGREGSGLVWRRPDGVLALNPLQRFARDAAAELYYELYGLPAGASVATRVSVTPRGGRPFFRRIFGGGRGARVEYTTVTDAPERARVRQRIDLGGLPPGRYVLEVELIEPASGERVARRQAFEITGQRTP